MHELDNKIIQESISLLLAAIGEDPNREGVLDTPARVAKFYASFITKGDEPNFSLTTFKNEDHNEMVVVKDITFFSLCEHHLLPFFGKASVAYIPTDKIIGLSKLPRIVNFFANRPQNQERCTTQIGNCISRALGTTDVAVVLEARHMCMEMRGIKSVGASTVTSYLSGRFRQPEVRAEFFSLSSD